MSPSKSWLHVVGLLLAVGGATAGAELSATDTKQLAARLSSCDPVVVREASREALEKRDPLVLYLAAAGQQRIGDKDEAAFLFIAAHLRTQRYGVFASADERQVLGIYSGMIGGSLMPSIEADPDFAESVIRRVITWDRNTPDSSRDRTEARTTENAAKLAEIDARLASLPGELRQDPERTAKARQRHVAMERLAADRMAKNCAAGTLDPKDVPATVDRIKVEAQEFVETHPMVKSRADALIRRVLVTSTSMDGNSNLPKRVTLSIRPQSKDRFYAKVDVKLQISVDRTLQSIDFTLACLTDDWRDDCPDDPSRRR